MSDKNKHGLSRYIPEDVKRKVRQKCGYGCVVCGTAIVEYEHVDPEFSEAKEHDPDKIVLLCSQCHAKVTRKFLSKESIKLA
ncbi:HNH endonuclease, partial [Vibrio parahaemolyticus]